MPDPAYHYDRGVKANETGDFPVAISEFTTAIEFASQNGQEYPAAYNGRGVAWEGLGNHDRAFADYDEAVRLDPEDADNFFNRALAYFNMTGSANNLELRIFEPAGVELESGLTWHCAASNLRRLAADGKWRNHTCARSKDTWARLLWDSAAGR